MVIKHIETKPCHHIAVAMNCTQLFIRVGHVEMQFMKQCDKRNECNPEIGPIIASAFEARSMFDDVNGENTGCKW